jgi:multidrug transporter EmrE-like cation transporter
MSPVAVGMLLVLACAAVEALAQISLKQSSLQPGRRRRWIAIGIGLFVGEAALYTAALQRLEVGVAYSLGATSFVFVALGSAAWLGESLPRSRWIGIGLILAGCVTLAARG